MKNTKLVVQKEFLKSALPSRRYTLTEPYNRIPFMQSNMWLFYVSRVYGSQGVSC